MCHIAPESCTSLILKNMPRAKESSLELISNFFSASLTTPIQ